MTRALLITHGELGTSLLASARQIYAVDAPLDVMSNDGQDLDALTAAVTAWLVRDDGDALLMVDVGGGSCGVAARLAVRDRPRTWILGGVNLPMVLTYLGSHGQLGSEDLVAKILDRSHNAVALLDSHPTG